MSQTQVPEGNHSGNNIILLEIKNKAITFIENNTDMGILIDVPFSQKDECRQAGGRWDATLKTWYIPDYAKICKFQQWIPAGCNIIVRTPLFVAQTHRTCWKCGAETPLIALATEIHLDLIKEENEDEGTEAVWRADYDFIMLFYINYLPTPVVSYIQQHYPYFNYLYSDTLKQDYWANGCIKCGALQGDWTNHIEPGIFCPVDEREAARITLIEHDFPHGFPVDSRHSYIDYFIESFLYKKYR